MEQHKGWLEMCTDSSDITGAAAATTGDCLSGLPLSDLITDLCRSHFPCWGDWFRHLKFGSGNWGNDWFRAGCASFATGSERLSDTAIVMLYRRKCLSDFRSDE